MIKKQIQFSMKMSLVIEDDVVLLFLLQFLTVINYYVFVIDKFFLLRFEFSLGKINV